MSGLTWRPVDVEADVDLAFDLVSRMRARGHRLDGRHARVGAVDADEPDSRAGRAPDPPRRGRAGGTARDGDRPAGAGGVPRRLRDRRRSRRDCSVRWWSTASTSRRGWRRPTRLPIPAGSRSVHRVRRPLAGRLRTASEDAGYGEVLAAAGFRSVRRFWRMSSTSPAARRSSRPRRRASPSAPPRASRSAAHPRARAGLLLGALREREAREEFDAWIEDIEARPGHDPDRWWIAALDGEPVGLLHPRSTRTPSSERTTCACSAW